MSDTPRAELTGAEKAVSETLDEVNFRMHGLTSSGSYHRQFIDWLGEHGYVVVARDGLERLRAVEQRAHELVDVEATYSPRQNAARYILGEAEAG